MGKKLASLEFWASKGSRARLRVSMRVVIQSLDDAAGVREIAAIIGRARGWLDKAAALGERQAQEVALLPLLDHLSLTCPDSCKCALINI